VKRDTSYSNYSNRRYVGSRGLHALVHPHFL
jgi:hypothetical protein